MSFRSERALRDVLSFCLARRATSIVVTRRAAVWTLRVGSLDSRIRPGIELSVVSWPAIGVTIRSVSAL